MQGNTIRGIIFHDTFAKLYVEKNLFFGNLSFLYTKTIVWYWNQFYKTFQSALIRKCVKIKKGC